MNKDFTEKKLNSFPVTKKIKVLFDLALFIEKNTKDNKNHHFEKLKKYHSFLANDINEEIKILNKEFKKIKKRDQQFQIYLMNLERLLGQSTKEYEFLVERNDKERPSKNKQLLKAICILDSVRSAHNVGAIFRTSECFGIEKVILTGLSPTPKSEHVQKTSMGSHEIQKWEYHQSAIKLVQELKRNNFFIIGVETSNESKNLFQYQFDDKKKYAFLFGHEQFGLSLELLKECDEVISIPLKGIKNSLNVSICHGIIIANYSAQMLE